MSTYLMKAEYIWLDGAQPTRELRSKTRILNYTEDTTIESFPEWGFDGSSTNQATGGNSDLVLTPVFFAHDPIRGEGNFLVMCEVMNPDGTPHVSNSRAQLRKVLEAGGNEIEAWFGFEQEYTLFEGRNPVGWPENGFPGPQGPYYCGVGAGSVFARELVEVHTEACIEAGLPIFGTNAEVMPGQWEFQLGYRGVDGDQLDPLSISDQMWLARWLLYRIGEDFDISPTIENKPVRGDWNGAGCHTNFSTKATRDPATGRAAIEKAIHNLSQKQAEHIKVYGANLGERLTGLHETCSIDEFRWGVSDRGASIRIPHQVDVQGHGYFEDRRPGANIDPYLVSARFIFCCS